MSGRTSSTRPTSAAATAQGNSRCWRYLPAAIKSASSSSIRRRKTTSSAGSLPTPTRSTNAKSMARSRLRLTWQRRSEQRLALPVSDDLHPLMRRQVELDLAVVDGEVVERVAEKIDRLSRLEWSES